MKFRLPVVYYLMACLILMISICVQAQMVVNLAEGQAQSILLQNNIGSVFIADPEVADYQVIQSIIY